MVLRQMRPGRTAERDLRIMDLTPRERERCSRIATAPRASGCKGRRQRQWAGAAPAATVAIAALSGTSSSSGLVQLMLRLPMPSS